MWKCLYCWYCVLWYCRYCWRCYRKGEHNHRHWGSDAVLTTNEELEARSLCSLFSTLCAIVFDNSVFTCNGFRTRQTYLRPFVHFVIYISLGSQNRPCHTPYISMYCNCNCNVCNFTTVLPKIHCTGRKAAAVNYSPFFAEFLIRWWWAPFGATRQCTLCRVWCTSAVLGGEHAPDLGGEHAPDCQIGKEWATRLGGSRERELSRSNNWPCWLSRGEEMRDQQHRFHCNATSTEGSARWQIFCQFTSK